MRWILLDLLRHIFPVKFPPNIAPTHCTTPRRHICGRVWHHGKNGAGIALCFTLRISAHPASHATEWRLKWPTHLLVLKAQNRALLQKTRFFCCKNHAVVASKTRPTTICSAMWDILPLRKLKKYQGHKGELTPRRSSQMTAPPLPAKAECRRKHEVSDAILDFARTK